MQGLLQDGVPGCGSDPPGVPGAGDSIRRERHTGIGLISLRKGETKVGLSEIRESRPDASRDIKSNTGRLGCA